MCKISSHELQQGRIRDPLLASIHVWLFKRASNAGLCMSRRCNCGWQRSAAMSDTCIEVPNPKMKRVLSLTAYGRNDRTYRFEQDWGPTSLYWMAGLTQLELGMHILLHNPTVDYFFKAL